LAESSVSGFDVAEGSGAHHAIARVASNIAAFVGRALKGPVNHPVSVRSFSEYTQVFGGLWQPSTLSYAVEQFFENGGRVALVVRVVNGARPPTLSLPVGDAFLNLQAISPGSREFLRASVDYDGLAPTDTDHFNLVLQRVRAKGSEQIEDQEIFRGLSIAPDDGRFVADALTESRLARLRGPLPVRRPDRTPPQASGTVVGYVSSNPDGDDGAPLSDYDIIGSTLDDSGMFALKSAPYFNLLCIPPLTRTQDLGLSALLVAARLCRERHAILLVDPPSSWTDAQTTLERFPEWPFRSENAAMFYPRIAAYDRLRGRVESFGSCGAAAGLISRWDDNWPVWAAAEADDAALRPGLKLAVPIADADRLRLTHAGVNVLSIARLPPRLMASPRTLAAGAVASTDWRFLSSRRLALFIMSSIANGTRWMMFETNSPMLWQRARAQVDAFLTALYDEGAFVGREAADSYFVICDERVNAISQRAIGSVRLLFGFAASRPGEFHACLVTHRAGATNVKPVSVNRLTTSRGQVTEEIESSILRGIAEEAV